MATLRTHAPGTVEVRYVALDKEAAALAVVNPSHPINNVDGYTQPMVAVLHGLTAMGLPFALAHDERVSTGTMQVRIGHREPN